VSAPLFLATGSPTPEELAAVVVLLTARSGAAPAAPPAPVRSRWAAPLLRGPLTPGSGAWRASTLPG